MDSVADHVSGTALAFRTPRHFEVSKLCRRPIRLYPDLSRELHLRLWGMEGRWPLQSLLPMLSRKGLFQALSSSPCPNPSRMNHGARIRERFQSASCSSPICFVAPQTMLELLCVLASSCRLLAFVAKCPDAPLGVTANKPFLQQIIAHPAGSVPPTGITSRDGQVVHLA